MWTVYETCHYVLDPSLADNSSKKPIKIAAFDVDWTLTYGECHLFPRLADDIHLLPNRLEVLEKLVKKGYILVAFTNQSSRSTKEDKIKQQRMETLLEKVHGLSLFMATRKGDGYRKPEKGMWNVMTSLLKRPIDMEASFFCGDALGRPGDFSDSDRGFGEASGLKVVEPEELFGTFDPASLTALLVKPKTLVLFVGAPGTGKSSLYREALEPKGFVHLNQDTLKTKAKVHGAFIKAVNGGQSICLDATHPKWCDRDYYYSAAMSQDYDIITLYFVRDGRRWNSLRDKPVSTMAYHVFFKYLDPPVPDYTPGTLLRVW